MKQPPASISLKKIKMKEKKSPLKFFSQTYETPGRCPSDKKKRQDIIRVSPDIKQMRHHMSIGLSEFIEKDTDFIQTVAISTQK